MSPVYIPVVIAAFTLVAWLAYLILGGFIVSKTGSADGLTHLGSAAKGFWKWRRRRKRKNRRE